MTETLKATERSLLGKFLDCLLLALLSGNELYGPMIENDDWESLTHLILEGGDRKTDDPT